MPFYARLRFDPTAVGLFSFTGEGNPFFILIFMLDMAHDVWYDNSYKYEKYERRKRQWKFPKGIISSVR